jgi:hypothetical protein
MTLHEVPCWTVECDEPGCGLDLGDLTEYYGWAQEDYAVECWEDAGGVVVPDGPDKGKAWCEKHVPPSYCKEDPDTHLHDWEADGQAAGGYICRHCEAEIATIEGEPDQQARS